MGKATGLDVLTAEVELTRARLSLVRYQVAYEIGRAKVNQIIGKIAQAARAKPDFKGEGK